MPREIKIQHIEQSINNVLLLKQFVTAIAPVRAALSGAQSHLLTQLLDICRPESIDPIIEIIDRVINVDTVYAKSSRELRNQRVFAVKSGVNRLLDTARQIYKESTNDAVELCEELVSAHNLPLELKYDNSRHFFLRFPASELEDGRGLHPTFVNAIKKKTMIECQTLDLVKCNVKIGEAVEEVLGMS